MRLLQVLFCLVAVGCSFAEDSYSLQKGDVDNLLVLSTLDGSLICLDQESGAVKWQIKDEPVVRVPMKAGNPMPLFLPDPIDGSLYVMGSADREVLQKLPFTIPQLVSSSPCRSSDGILYTGKKMDNWFSVNPKTGTKKSFFSAGSNEYTCPKEGPESVFVGRTEYNIVMMDTLKNNKMWNVTFYDYASYTMDHESQQLYGFVHFTGSSSGRVLTVQRDSGAFQWQYEHGSPIIGIYLLQNTGLLSVPFTSIAESTLDSLIDEVHLRRTSRLGFEFKPNDLKLLPTLYVGEHIHGLYALPSLIDLSAATIELARRGTPLLDGPVGPGPEHPQIREEPSGPAVILLGHYKVPDYSKTRLQIAGGPENRTREIDPKTVADSNDEELWKYVWYRVRFRDILQGKVSGKLLLEAAQSGWRAFRASISTEDNLVVKVLMVALLLFVVILTLRLSRQMNDIQQMSQGSRHSDKFESSLASNVTIAHGEGELKVGKITVYKQMILGKGSEGTCVFQGEFDSRPVAVKRILPECFSLADREVELLRESDTHPNVVRYFCTEQDKQFRYIALELCLCTVQDYVLGKCLLVDKITPLQILHEAAQGLAHLHSLHIVHRDVKPQNVLLSMETAQGQVRAMISDFGLCKKLPLGRVSFSRRSGITGTDGWIAPELLMGKTRPTCSVDVFSMGCVFFYVLTKGEHPFGGLLHRQSNIMLQKENLSALKSKDRLARGLIKRMVAFEPSDRPSIAAILKHPYFWKQPKILSFFMDVSDRIENESEDSHLLKWLEEPSGVLEGDWRTIIDSEVAQDLRKYRNYRGDSVRDLLRAIRNKKHHYRELSKQAQRNLGEIPLGFIQYWTSRFPLLLLHSWLTLQCVREEPVFRQYYDASSNFPKLPRREAEFAPIEIEGFAVRKQHPTNEGNWRVNRRLPEVNFDVNNKKQQDILEGSWRVVNRRLSEMKESPHIDLGNKQLYDNQWFQQWYDSDFRDDNAYIQWREQEFYKFHRSEEEREHPYQPEFPMLALCQVLRRKKQKYKKTCRRIQKEQENLPS